MAILEWKCKCDRCGKEYVVKPEDVGCDILKYCPSCNTLSSMMRRGFEFGVKRRKMNTEDPIDLEDYIAMCYLYAKGWRICMITDLFRLPESVVRAIIFDVKSGETPLAVDVRGALNKRYGMTINQFDHENDEK